MTKKEAIAIAGSLSEPSKMPCHGYSIPAQRCITGSKLVSVPGSTCSGCYALKGNYKFPNVKDALEGRFQSLEHPQWEDALVTLIQGTGNKFFRWHDSGDLQSTEHLGKIANVCRRTPKVKHWLPTREYKIVQDWIAAGNKVPKNLTIRLSAHMVDKAPPAGYGLPTSTVHSTDPKDKGPFKILNSIPASSRVCPAPKQGNNCGDCRACWNPKVKNVSYHIH